MREIPTVKVVSPLFAGGFLIINAADFDPAVHTRFDESASADSSHTPAATEPLPPAGKGTEAKGASPSNGETPDAPASDEDTVRAMLAGKVVDVAAAIKQVATVEELDALLAHESANAARKSVAQAIEARRAELAQG